ncbi:MAG: polysaccharide biosynthesis protein [Candidatus Fimenecus sp.]
MKQKTKIGKRTTLLILADCIVANCTYFLMVFVHWNFRMDMQLAIRLSLRIPFILLFYIGCNILFKVYQTMWKYAGLYDILRFGTSTLFATAGVWICDYTGMKICQHLIASGSDIPLYFNVLPLSVYWDSWLMISVLCLLVRIFYRSARLLVKEGKRHAGKAESVNAAQKQILVVGAGSLGNALITELQLTDYRLGVPVAILDDDVQKIGMSILGTPVVGNCDQAADAVKKYDIDVIYFCITEIDETRKRELLEKLLNTGCTVKMATEHNEFVGERKSTLKAARQVDILDLLSRPPVELNPDVCKYVTDEVVLVTGGGGSIGSELCRQIAKYAPAKIIIFDIYENNAYALKNSLDRKYFGTPQIEIRIGSVREQTRLREVFAEFHPTSVFHAAAHKHVPLMEDSPYEAIKNNILGTYNTAKVADEFSVRNFVLLSTDKAVNPTNVMGASKRCCELVVQHFAKISENTKFAAVRFGNVLGSNGSVIPLFKEQLENGGPLTVTHPDITRYFMTIPEAAQLVVQAGGLAKGGEIFVLDMGEPVKIITLAEKLIKLSGYEPYVDIDIQFTGLRPGEKLYEELILPSEKEGMHKTQNDKIFVTAPYDFDDNLLMEHIAKIDTMQPEEARAFLKELVPNYNTDK